MKSTGCLKKRSKCTGFPVEVSAIFSKCFWCKWAVICMVFTTAEGFLYSLLLSSVYDCSWACKGYSFFSMINSSGLKNISSHLIVAQRHGTNSYTTRWIHLGVNITDIARFYSDKMFTFSCVVNGIARFLKLRQSFSFKWELRTPLSSKKAYNVFYSSCRSCAFEWAHFSFETKHLHCLRRNTSQTVYSLSMIINKESVICSNKMLTINTFKCFYITW